MRLVANYRIRVMGENLLKPEEAGDLAGALSAVEEEINSVLPEGFYAKIEKLSPTPLP